METARRTSLAKVRVMTESQNRDRDRLSELQQLTIAASRRCGASLAARGYRHRDSARAAPLRHVALIARAELRLGEAIA